MVQQVVVPIYTQNDEPPPYSETQETGSLPTADDTSVNIQPLPDKDGVIITVQPPKMPANPELDHVPCDIALVIDVSGSMGADAPVPGESESTGLSVLDLVKHACRTILSTMTADDRLAIVTFSNGSKVLQPLKAMTDENKETAKTKIEAMKLEGCTNLWYGLKDGIKLFKGQENTGRVPAVMVLTDGVPNHMCPPQGYVPALKAMGSIVPSIHTFGFGYTLNSGLLKSISELGNGNYSFIPDAGMIGTVFVHAVANLQSTFAINASLRLTYPDHVTIQQTTGAAIDRWDPVRVAGGNYELIIPLGNIQYGQSRDIYLQWKSSPGNDDEISPPFINAALQYSQMAGTQHTVHLSRGLRDLSFTTLSDSETAYHISRSRICAFLASLFPIDPLGEHRVDKALKTEDGLTQKQAQVHDLAASLPASLFPDDASCASLLQDLVGPEPLGQVSLALSRGDYFSRWGQHYLPSLHGAHTRQLCNSFKDPGPLRHGTGSPLFVRCRDALSSAFDDLPAPEPSKMHPGPAARHFHRRAVGTRYRTVGTRMRMDANDDNDGDDWGQPAGYSHSSFADFSMKSYNSSAAPCFAAHTPVILANGRRVRISTLRRGMRVLTPLGARAVVALLVTRVSQEVMVRLEGVLVTPWHPVAPLTAADSNDPKAEEHGPDGWVFPAQVTPVKEVRYTGRIYSVLLRRDEDVGAHAILLGGFPRGGRGGGCCMPFWGVTLGHGLINENMGEIDVRAHEFFGSYDEVWRSLVRLWVRQDGLVLGGGVRRNKSTGLVEGFKRCGGLER